MQLINRTALVVVPKQPYIDWANTLDDTGPKLNIDAPHYEYNVYLIDDVEDESDLVTALRRQYRTIFEYELAGWHLDEKDWPSRRGFKTFTDWFEVKVCTMVFDLGKSDIQFETFEV